LPEIEGLFFPDSSAELVTQLVSEARLIAGAKSTFKANNQIRAAVEGATASHKGHGIFMMIEPRKNGASVWFPSLLELENKYMPLTEDSFRFVAVTMSQSHNAIKAKLEANRRGAVSKTIKRNPPWTRDELILTLDVYFRVPPWTINGTHAEVRKLSELLQRLSVHVDPPDAGRYRNVNGTYMKLMNFQSVDPLRGGRGLKGAGREDREIWNHYTDRRDELIRDAIAIRAALNNPRLLQIIKSTPDESDFTDAIEGRVLTRLHRSRERSAKLAKTKRERVMKEKECLECEVCGFDFFKRYGELGLGFLECHHILPVSQVVEPKPTKLEDLALVCANCHRMLHRTKNWLTIEVLRELLLKPA